MFIYRYFKISPIYLSYNQLKNYKIEFDKKKYQLDELIKKIKGLIKGKNKWSFQDINQIPDLKSLLHN